MAAAITVPAHTTVVVITTMEDIIGEALMELSSDTTDSVGRNGIFLLGQVVGVRGTTLFKMVCANHIHIAVRTTETPVGSISSGIDTSPQVTAYAGKAEYGVWAADVRLLTRGGPGYSI